MLSCSYCFAVPGSRARLGPPSAATDIPVGCSSLSLPSAGMEVDGCWYLKGQHGRTCGRGQLIGLGMGYQRQRRLSAGSASVTTHYQLIYVLFGREPVVDFLPWRKS